MTLEVEIIATTGNADRCFTLHDFSSALTHSCTQKVTYASKVKQLVAHCYQYIACDFARMTSLLINRFGAVNQKVAIMWRRMDDRRLD